jgi:HSP20 family protein
MKNSLIRYNKGLPSLGLPSLFDRDEFLTPFSSFFDDFFNESSVASFGNDFFGKGAYPKVDVSDEEDKIVIDAEVPGLTKEQVSVELDNGILKIKGTKQDVYDSPSKKYVHKELKHSSFCRSFSIGDNIDKDKLDAKFSNGVLTITLPKITPDPKREEVKKIEIK